MPTTTTTPGPIESQLRRGGAVTSRVTEKSEKPRMVRLTVNLPSHLIEQMRDAVYWTLGAIRELIFTGAMRVPTTVDVTVEATRRYLASDVVLVQLFVPVVESVIHSASDLTV